MKFCRIKMSKYLIQKTEGSWKEQKMSLIKNKNK